MNKQKQSGFAHLMVITVILAVALVGTLGYIFWQNFMQPKTTKVSSATTTSKTTSSSTPKTTTTTITTPSTNPNDSYLVLDDWGIKFKLPTNLGDNQITYHKMNNSYLGDYYEFSTSRVEALGDACVPGGLPYVSLGGFSRMKSPSTAVASAPTLLNHFDDYYYYYSHPQAACSEKSTDIQSQDLAIIENFLQGVEKE